MGQIDGDKVKRKRKQKAFRDPLAEEKTHVVTKKRDEPLIVEFIRELDDVPVTNNKNLGPDIVEIKAQYEKNNSGKGPKIHYIRRDDVKRKEDDLSKILKEYTDAGYIVEELTSPISDIIHAIYSRIDIEDIPLYERLKDSNFRFVSSANPIASKELCEIFALIAESNRNKGFEEGLEKGAKKGTVAAATKRITDADDFARNLYSVVNKVQVDTGVRTIRATVDMLNQKGIESPNGGKWNKSSLQLVQNRWKQLGLIQNPKPK